MKDFRYSNRLHRFIKQATCYKNPESPMCIDFIISTNTPRSFQPTCDIETWLCYAHWMTLSIMRKTIEKLRPKILNIVSPSM